MSTIAVFGATGMLGTPVTEELIKAGYQVRALVRSPQKAKQRLPEELICIEGSLEDPDSIKETLKGADFVYISLSTGPKEKNRRFKTEIEGIQNILLASKNAGIKRVGYLSSLIKDYQPEEWWVFQIKNLACDLIKKSGINYSIFYPSNFFENLTDLMMVGSNVLLVGRQETKSYWISAHDYGRMVSNAFQLDEGNCEHVIQGKAPYNFDEAVDLFIQNYEGKDLKKRRIPVWFLKAVGLLSAEADFAWRINEAINHYDEEFQGKETWEKLREPELDLKEFARRASGE